MLLAHCLQRKKLMIRKGNDEIPKDSRIPPTAKSRTPRSSDDESSSSSDSSDRGSVEEFSSFRDRNPPTTITNIDNVEAPGRFDVLLGRGKYHYCHEGNVRMLRIVESFKPHYTSARKSEKTEITKQVLALILQNDYEEECQGAPIRFLQGTDNGWYQVPRRVAHKKVAHCLREKKKTVSAAGATCINGQSTDLVRAAKWSGNESSYNGQGNSGEAQYEPLCPQQAEPQLSSEQVDYLREQLSDDDDSVETEMVT